MVEVKENTTLKKYDFVIFFACDWETPWRGHYLIEALSKQLSNSKILCVENPVDLFISLFKHPLRWIMQQNRKTHLRKVNDNLFIYRPWILLNVHIAAKISIFRKINISWIKIQIDKVLNKNNFRLDFLVTWITDPFQEDYLNVRDGNLTVFDCYDEYAEQSHNSIFRNKYELLERERRIVQKVDITFVVSRILYENNRFYSNSIHIIPNAVDTIHFGQAIKQSTLVAKDIRHIPTPVIGFLGNLSDRIDFTLLNWLAIRNKDWSFVLIGGKGDHIKNKQMQISFAGNNNVFLLGNKPYAQLPGYLKAFDICLIPFRDDNPFSLSCSPLKLYEYLATGKPIISTNLPGVFPLKSFIRIARSKEEFEHHIKEALQEKSELHEKRIKISEANSWEKRAEEIISILGEMLNSRTN